MKLTFRKRVNSLYSFLLFNLLFIVNLFSQTESNYFYHNLQYGSEAQFNPINLILNGSYDIIQLEGKNRDIFNRNYYVGFKNVANNLTSPFHHINKFGWKNFISSEIFPFRFNKTNAQWWPNYQLHLIGGGLTYSKLTEWFSSKGFDYPKSLAITTTMIYHYLNEVVENENTIGTNVDPIADIYIFDIGGIILFSSDKVKKFFSEELNLADWSLQPSFVLNNKNLQNNGQYFSIKWKFPNAERSYLFYYFGMNGLTGISYKLDDEHALSAGVGLRAKKLISVNDKMNKKSVETSWNYGIFYDRNNSLLVSLFLSGLTDNFININIYPGVIKFGKFTPGIWTIVKRNGSLLFGISTIYAPGLGISI
ncbi:MAG: hypothetical protein KF721_08180 [Ignavibacteriaceae bacterium]|nr:hypothetical protein [Ignavibacteriaceae bacterium]